MKITTTSIEIFDLREFTKFVYENNLINSIQLKEPIKDKSGKILVKEMVNIKEGTLKKLEQIQDQFDPVFKVDISKDLIRQIEEAMVMEMLPRISKKDNSFLSHLYDNDHSSISSYKSFLKSSLNTKKVVLVLYRCYLENREFFYHIVNMGLISLGVVIQKPTPIKFINRYAFQCGLFADMILSDTAYWQSTFKGETDLMKVTKLSARIAQNLGMSSLVVDTLDNHTVNGINSELATNPINYSVLEKNPFLESISTGKEEENDAHPDDKSSSEDEVGEHLEAAKAILGEALKIARFIEQTYKKISSSANDAELLVSMFSYNMERGVFKKEVVSIIVERFKQYERNIKKFRLLGEIENRCKYPPSAWAYPKQHPSQVLCKNKKYDCPNFISGWDINVIANQSAIGYIGTPLPAGSYPKCKLEEFLDDLRDDDW